MEQEKQKWDEQECDLATALGAVRNARALIPRDHEDLIEDLEWIEEAIKSELESENRQGEQIRGEDFYTPQRYPA